MRKKPMPLVFVRPTTLAPRYYRPTIAFPLFRLTKAPARRNPHGSQPHSPACGCRGADASVGLKRLHGDPRWRPSSCSMRLRQVGLIATCATPDLLFNIQTKHL